jgi:hypothetical protein
LLASACAKDNPAFDDCETDLACADETRGDGDGDSGDGDPGDGDPGDGDPGDGDGDPGDGDGDPGDGDADPGDGDGDPAALPTCPDSMWVSIPVLRDTFLDNSSADGSGCTITSTSARAACMARIKRPRSRWARRYSTAGIRRAARKVLGQASALCRTSSSSRPEFVSSSKAQAASASRISSRSPAGRSGSSISLSAAPNPSSSSSTTREGSSSSNAPTGIPTRKPARSQSSGGGPE